MQNESFDPDKVGGAATHDPMLSKREYLRRGKLTLYTAAALLVMTSSTIPAARAIRFPIRQLRPTSRIIGCRGKQVNCWENQTGLSRAYCAIPSSGNCRRMACRRHPPRHAPFFGHEASRCSITSPMRVGHGSALLGIGNQYLSPRRPPKILRRRSRRSVSLLFVSGLMVTWSCPAGFVMASEAR